jgi:hypothetical protein
MKNQCVINIDTSFTSGRLYSKRHRASRTHWTQRSEWASEPVLTLCRSVKLCSMPNETLHVNMLFWDATPCMVRKYLNFGWTLCLYLNSCVPGQQLAPRTCYADLYVWLFTYFLQECGVWYSDSCWSASVGSWLQELGTPIYMFGCSRISYQNAGYDTATLADPPASAAGSKNLVRRFICLVVHVFPTRMRDMIQRLLLIRQRRVLFRHDSGWQSVLNETIAHLCVYVQMRAEPQVRVTTASCCTECACVMFTATGTGSIPVWAKTGCVASQL